VHQQEDANAWAGQLTGVGNILGFVSGYVNLPRLTGGFFGDTQFKVLCVIASFALTSTVVISCLTIHERDPRLDEPPPSEKTTGVLSFFRQIFQSMMRLSPQIRKVCEVQFFSWIGWFPFLFYITTYIGQLSLNPYFVANPDLTPKEIDEAWESATRVGTFSMLIFAITSLSSNLLLPFLVIPTYQSPLHLDSISSPSTSHRHDNEANPGDGYGWIKVVNWSFLMRKSRDIRSRLSRILLACRIPWLTLRRAWLISHLSFALCMLATFFISSVSAATALAGVVGFSWALTLWAPFALISAEISKRDTQARRLQRSNGMLSEKEDQAGVILGLHNVAVSAPQIFASLVCSAIFKAAQKPRGVAGDISTAWVLRFGGLAALIAACMTYRVEEEGDRAKREVRAGMGVEA
jgi:solute carrier family 45 protein 1/2/4